MPTKEENVALIKYLIDNNKHDFRWFCEKVMGCKIIGDFHQMVLKGWQLFLYPRGTLKTTIYTKYRAIWELLKDPNKRILIVTLNNELAASIMRFIKEELTSNPYLKIAGLTPKKEKGQDVKWTENRLLIKRTKVFSEASITAVGVGSSITGQHFDLQIYDDIINETTINTKSLRNKTYDWYKYSLSLLEPHGQISVVGTRYHDDDVYDKLIDSEDYEINCRAAYEKDGKPYDVFKDDGEVLYPERFTLEMLRQIRQRQGSYIYSSQYNNDPIAEEDAVFKREWLREWTELPPLKYFVTVDLAGWEDQYSVSSSNKKDFTAIVVCGVSEANQKYVVEIRRGRWTPYELIDKLFEINEKYNPRLIGVEIVALQQGLQFMLLEQMKIRGRIPYEPIKRGHASKFARIMALQTFFEAGEIYLPKGEEILTEELMRFPRAKNDDCTDALADQIQFWKSPKFARPVRDIRGTFAEAYERLGQSGSEWPYKYREGSCYR